MSAREIIADFGLKVEEVEPGVFKVLNPEQEVLLYTSDVIRNEKTTEGYITEVAYLYYVIVAQSTAISGSLGCLFILICEQQLRCGNHL